MAVYAVGDIQGCYKPLRKLLKKVGFDPSKDQLWCVGDLVNRGPNSLQVLRYLKSLGDACVTVLGNHDIHLLRMAAGGKRHSSKDTIAEVLEAPDQEELIEWLRHRPLLHHDPEINWCMVHAGLHPDWSLKRAKKRAARVEKKLQGKNWKRFCRKVYKSPLPMHEPPKGDKRHVPFSLAVFTYTRYCTRHGYFNWSVAVGRPPSWRQRAWYDHKNLKWSKDCRVVFGHWAARGLVRNRPHVLGLDTGCVWGGKLTLARIDVDPPVLVSKKSKAHQRID